MHENGVFIAHCSASNINLTRGIAPVRKYLDMKIGLGSDVAGGQAESIFRLIIDAIGVSKMYLRYGRRLNENQKIFKFIYRNRSLPDIFYGICGRETC